MVLFMGLTTFEQNVSLRLTPEGALFLDEHGQPSVYSTGHGDLPDALRRSGLPFGRARWSRKRGSRCGI